MLNVSSSSPRASTAQLATFYVDDMYLGIDVQRVQEVLHSQPITRVPKSPAVVEGLINLRGQIVTAIDMRRRLQMPARDEAAKPMNMVVRTDDGPVSLLVDQIGEVLHVEQAQYEAPPANLHQGVRELIQGVYKLKDGLLLVLDAERAADLSAATQ